MAVFQPRTFSDFFERMLHRVVARTELTDLEAGGILSTVLGGVARELDDISYQIVALQGLWDLDTATGEDLDARAADVNPDEITRKGAVKASGTVVFRRNGSTASTVVAPAGTAIAASGGDPQYVTTADATITSGTTESAAVGAVASVGGTAGNLDPGLWSTDAGGPSGISEIVVNVAGVDEVNNDTSFTGGQDKETDSQLRQRIKMYLRSLSRGTPDSLRAAVLGVSVEGYGRIVVCSVVEEPAPNLGKVTVYIDDGNGTTEVDDDNLTAALPETVISPAIGGEIRLMLSRGAVVDTVSPVVQWTDSQGYNGAPGTVYTLTEGNPGDALTSYDYLLNYATGKITINYAVPTGSPATTPSMIPDDVTSTDSVSGLQPGDTLTARYAWYVGLIGEAQKIIDGDTSDRTNYPGYRAAGTYVKVYAPAVYWQNITGTVALESGFTSSEVLSAASNAIEQYVNGLEINGDVIFSELYYAVQSVSGVFDVTFTTPTSNVIIGEGELARTSASRIVLTGA